MTIAIVAAVSENGVIGRDGGLPWRLPDDLKFFKRLTMGHPVIMGRRTWDEIRKPLPGRRNIVVTRNVRLGFPGAERAESLAQALELACGDGQVFIIGGAEIYRQALPLADRMYLTHVHAVVGGDTYFPAWEAADWRVESEQHFQADERNAHGFTIREHVRRRTP